jgi:hypothetical protein
MEVPTADGQAIEFPLKVAVAVVVPVPADVMDCPGVITSGFLRPSAVGPVPPENLFS